MLHQKLWLEFDQPMKALSMHIQKPYQGKVSKFLQLCQKATPFFVTKLLHAYGQCVNIVLAKYRIVPSLATHIQKSYFGKILFQFHSSHFVKIFLIQTPPCIYSKCLHCIGKLSTTITQSKCSVKSCGRSLISP